MKFSIALPFFRVCMVYVAIFVNPSSAIAVRFGKRDKAERMAQNFDKSMVATRR